MTLKPCPRCGFGVDSDGDGNCDRCARLSDEQAGRIKAALHGVGHDSTLAALAESAIPPAVDQATCPHEDFLASVTVNRLLAGDGTGADSVPKWWMAEIRVKCARCDLPFEWVGGGPGGVLPCGLLKDRPAVDPSRQELRAPLVPKGKEPLPGLGFTVGLRADGGGSGRIQ